MNGIGKRIKDLLDLKNMSQRELSEIVGCTEVSISRYISEERNPRSDLLAKIADALGVSMEYLAGTKNNEDESNKSVKELKESIIKNKKDASVLEVYKKYEGQVTPEDLDDILKVVVQTRKQRQKDNDSLD